MKQLIQKLPSTLMLILGLTLIVSTTGCKREGCTDPLSSNYDPDAKVDDGTCEYPEGTLSLMVHHMVGMDPFSTSATFTASNGRQYKFTTARFYLSQFTLENEDGGKKQSENYLQIEAGTMNYELGSIAPGSYHMISFNIGVDSAANHVDPTTYPAGHALSASNPSFDHWTWNSGYIFLKIEGLTDTTAAMNGAIDTGFEMHIGTDMLLRKLDIHSHFDVANAGSHTVHMNIDWGKALDGIELRDGGTNTMSNMPLATQIANNMANAITID